MFIMHQMQFCVTYFFAFNSSLSLFSKAWSIVYKAYLRNGHGIDINVTLF